MRRVKPKIEAVIEAVEIEEAVNDWSRLRPDCVDFRCGWCAFFMPDEHQAYTRDNEVSRYGYCCVKPPQLFPVKGANPNENEKRWFATLKPNQQDISVCEPKLGGRPDRVLYSVSVDKRVSRERTGCKFFKSCFRKEFKTTNESEVK